MNKDLDGVTIRKNNYWELNYGDLPEHIDNEEVKIELGFEYFRKEIYKRYEEIESITRRVGHMKDIAKYLNVSRNTLYKWIRVDDVLNERIKKGQELGDYTVENSMYHGAVDRWVDEPEYIYEYEPVLDEEGNQVYRKLTDDEGKVLLDEHGNELMEEVFKTILVGKKVKRKFIEGDKTRQFFITQNRMPDRWKNMQHLKYEGDSNVKVEYAKKTLDTFDKFFGKKEDDVDE